jgi:hypothetical protein
MNDLRIRHRFFRWTGIAAFSLPLLVASAPAVASFPDDILRIRAAHELLMDHRIRQSEPRRIVNLLSDITMTHCLSVLSRSRIVDHVSPRRGAIREAITRAIDHQLQSAGDSPEALLGILREFSSPQTAERILSAELGFPERLTRENANITYEADFHPKPLVQGLAPRLDAQMTVQADRGPISLMTTSQIVEESGGSGAGNQVIDAGEWVRFQFLLQNQGDRPLFSTSLFVESDDPCVFVDTGREQVLAEMTEKSAHSDASVWVYFSSSCTDSTPREIVLRLLDTHVMPDIPQQIRLQFQPRRDLHARLSDVTFDTDIPGHSDGSNSRSLTPGLHFELSTGLTLETTETGSAHMRMAIPPDTRNLFASLTYRHLHMTAEGSGRFLPGDDVDGVVLPSELLENALSRLSGSQTWYDPHQGGILWVAAESLVALPSPNSPPTPMPIQRARRAAVDRSRERKSKSGPTAEVHAEASIPTPAGEHCHAGTAIPGPQLISMLRPFVSLTPRVARTMENNGILATDGYEVVIDRDGFLQAYRALLEPRAPLAPPPSGNAPVLYRFRHYIPLDLPPIRTRPDPPLPAAPALMPDRHPYAPPPVPAPLQRRYRPPVRLDIGLGTGVSQSFAAVGWTGWENDFVATFLGGARLVIGPGFNGFLHLEGGGRTDRRYALGEFLFDAGGGYTVNSGGLMEFYPWLSMGVQWRSVDHEITRISSPAFVFRLGMTMRIFIGDVFGFHLDTSYGFAPGLAGPLNSEDSLLSGHTFRFFFGPTFRFPPGR